MFLSPTEDDIRRVSSEFNVFEPLRRAVKESAKKEDIQMYGHTIALDNHIPPESSLKLDIQEQKEPKPKSSLLKYLKSELNNPFMQPQFEQSYFNNPPVISPEESPRQRDQIPIRESSEHITQHKLSSHSTKNNQMKTEVIPDISIYKEPPGKFKSLDLKLRRTTPFNGDSRKEIRIIFDNRIRLTKLIDPQSTVKEVISSLRSTLEMKGYIYKNVKNALLLKDENGFELDEEEIAEYYLLNRNQFKLEFRKHGPEYALAAEGSFELLDVPEKIIDMAQEDGEYKFRVAWKKRKNGAQPLPSYVSEKAIMCHNPTFLFEFYAGFAKKIVK